jgi:hypothetical protein
VVSGTRVLPGLLENSPCTLDPFCSTCKLHVLHIGLHKKGGHGMIAKKSNSFLPN